MFDDLSWAVSGPAVGGVVLTALVAYLVTRQLVLARIEAELRTNRLTWDDVLVRRFVHGRLSAMIPFVVVWVAAPYIDGLDTRIESIIRRAAVAGIVFSGWLTLSALLKALNDIYEEDPEREQRPIQGYLTVVRLILALFAGVLILAALLDRSPVVFLSGLGALTAVLLLVFSDTILSFVASLNLQNNDLVRVGDWIEVPSLGIDGDVVDIGLHTVKIQNFDNTLTTLPIRTLNDTALVNWRAMQQSGGRRIKRSIPLDQSCIRFLTDDEVATFGSWALLRDYIAGKRAEILPRGEPHDRDGVSRGQRRLTNVGTYRAWMLAHLRTRTDLHQEGMTFLVRQLAPGPEGLALEVYVFTTTTDWGAYEVVQADIFDHLLAALPLFDLRVFQHPTGADLSRGGLGSQDRP